MSLTMSPTTKTIEVTEMERKLIAQLARSKMLELEREAESKGLRSLDKSQHYSIYRTIWLRFGR